MSICGLKRPWKSRTVKLLNKTVDNELGFDERIDNVPYDGPKGTYCANDNKKIPRFQYVKNSV